MTRRWRCSSKSCVERPKPSRKPKRLSQRHEGPHIQPSARRVSHLLLRVRENFSSDPATLSQQGYAYVRAEHGLTPICRRFVELASQAQARLRVLHTATALDALEFLVAKLFRQRGAPARATPFS
jgi:hypothetical protein